MFEIFFNPAFILAIIIHGILIITGLILLDRLQARLDNHFLDSLWELVIEPLYRAAILVIFIYLAYPLLFGLQEATAISTLLAESEGRTNALINVVFLSSLLLPLIPLVGKQIEFVLPIQAILCCMMVFSWLAEYLNIEVSYWPGFVAVIVMTVLALLTHWLSVQLSRELGDKLDQKFHVLGFEKLIAEAIILFMQAPVILVYSLSLGAQLN